MSQVSYANRKIVILQVYTPNDKHSGVLDEFIFLSALLEIDLSADSISQVDLTIQKVIEGRAVGV